MAVINFDSQEFEGTYSYGGSDLGAVYTKKETTWKVWSPGALGIRLQLFTTGSDEEKGSRALGGYEMRPADKGVWQLTLKGDYAGVYYVYRIRHVDGVQETPDVYSKAVGVDGQRSMVVDLRSTDPEGWDSDCRVYCESATKAIVWETHIKDFSSSEESGMINKGKYLAFTEENTHLKDSTVISTGIAHIKEMGFTHVQLMPVYDYATVIEAKPNKEQYNWGYDPMHYNVPEGSYSTDPWHGEVRIREMKQMIQSLHKNGIGVIMDVVYNHTYESKDSWFHKTVPHYYHRLNQDGRFSNGSGCGNEIASERSMCRKYILDSVRYWAEEYHIDGFRFDLMGVLDVTTMNQIRAMLDSLPNGKQILMYGEPWAASGVVLRPGEQPADKRYVRRLDPRIGIFNDDTRDCIKGSVFRREDTGFINGNKTMDWKLKNSMMGWCGPQRTVRVPTQTVTYCSAHDNSTLWDKLTNTVDESLRDYDYPHPERLAANKMAAAIVMTSQGIPFLQSGEEFARTKYGDANSYRSDIQVNKLDWKRLRVFNDLTRYYQGLIKIRKHFSPFQDATEKSAQNMYFSYTKEQVVAYTLAGNPEDEWKMVAVIANAGRKPYEVELETWSYIEMPETWYVMANGEQAGLVPLKEIKDSKIEVPARSVMILAAPKA